MNFTWYILKQFKAQPRKAFNLIANCTTISNEIPEHSYFSNSILPLETSNFHFIHSSI